MLDERYWIIYVHGDLTTNVQHLHLISILHSAVTANRDFKQVPRKRQGRESSSASSSLSLPHAALEARTGQPKRVLCWDPSLLYLATLGRAHSLPNQTSVVIYSPPSKKKKNLSPLESMYTISYKSC